MTRILAAAAISAMLFAQPAHATDYLDLSVGYFDFSQDDNAAVQYGVGYRYDDIYHGLRPGVGVNVSSDQSVYGYAGLYWDVPITSSLLIVPNFAAGAYSKGDSGKDLGHAIEFRSGIELDYQFPYGTKLGVAFNHISNASLGNDNPGAETIMLVYQHPLNLLADEPRKKRWWDKP